MRSPALMEYLSAGDRKDRPYIVSCKSYRHIPTNTNLMGKKKKRRNVKTPRFCRCKTGELMFEECVELNHPDRPS